MKKNLVKTFVTLVIAVAFATSFTMITSIKAEAAVIDSTIETLKDDQKESTLIQGIHKDPTPWDGREDI